MNKFQIITLGGTIDKVYFDAKSTYQIGAPYIEEILDSLPLSLDYQVLPLMRKDSLEMTEDDRRAICEAVKQSSFSHILITHGTDTMTETANSLSSIKGKTIVLTGALQPAIFKTTDAVFNVGSAIAALQCLSNGVYIAMNGRIFSHDKVKKDLNLNRFVCL